MNSAGYSGTPLAKKLGIKAGMFVMLVDAPDGFVDLLGDLPEGVAVSANGREIPMRADTVCVHSDTPNAAELAAAVREVLDGAA